MPITPIPVGYGIASIHYSRIDDGDLNVMTFGFRNTPAADPSAIGPTINSIWLARFTPAMTCDSYNYEGVGILIQTAGGQQSGFHSDVQVGTNVAEPVTPAAAARITKQSILSGRKHRGRMYLTPALVAQTGVEEGGTLTSGQQSSLATAATGVLGDLTSAGYPMVLLHKDLSTPDTIVNLEVRASIGTQRRRQHLS